MKKIAKWFKKYFIPHAHNSHEPHMLRHESMLFFFLIVIILELGFLAQVFLVFDKTKFLAAVLPGVLTDLANREREDYNAQPLVENDLLTRAAELKAQDMAEKGYFAHTSPEGRSPWYWLAQVGYRYASAGENLAVHFDDSVDVNRAWMNSPTHKANIIKSDYTEIGIGVAKGYYQGESTIFVAQFFGKPMVVAPVEPTPTNVVAIADTPKENTVATTPTPTPKPTPATKPTPKATTPVKPTPTPIETPTPEPTQLAQNTTPIVPTETTVLGEETITTSNRAGSSVRAVIERALTSPSQSVAIFYSGIAMLIIVAMLIVFFIRSEVKHPKVMARGLALIAVIILLLYANLEVGKLNTLVPADNANYSFIAS